MRYDVIIVGAGSAGCVLAARLSEDRSRSVLLLEAGPDYPDPAGLPSDIAGGHRPAFSHDWGYHSEPLPGGGHIHLARAKLVGGCSATNATFALRGTPADYDEWAALGNPGWSFAEVLPFFRRVERDADFGGEFHGREGYLPIRRYPPEELTPIQGTFLAACAEAGYRQVEDLNMPDGLGAGRIPMNTQEGRRQSAALTYLAAARGRPNLTIRSDVLVDRVLFAGDRAIGVGLAGPDEAIRADRVVLAAGAYGSPAILMRSGIGPADHLRSLGIPVVADRPGVGRNLSDHPLLALRQAVRWPAPEADEPSFQTVLTLRSADDVPGHDLHLFPMSVFPDAESPTGASYALFVSLLKPRSRGNLRLRSADPNAAPIIDLGYFADPADLPRFVEGVRAARRLARTAPLAGLTVEELFPGPAVSDADAEADLAAAIWQEIGTYHHPVGTCRMGPTGDALAVVDPRANVYATEALSVVDASIMPTIPAANTNLPTLMIAERCAAWLGS